jgi:hypothetical protein
MTDSKRRRCFLPKRLVGSLLVVFHSIKVVGTLLQSHRSARRNLELERAMEAFLTPVLLRFARFNALQSDAEP